MEHEHDTLSLPCINRPGFTKLNMKQSIMTTSTLCWRTGGWGRRGRRCANRWHCCRNRWRLHARTQQRLRCAFILFEHLPNIRVCVQIWTLFFAFALQLKVYEDDFRRERSDKQMLQRLLLKKSPPSKELVLMHRCNNEQQPLGGDKRTKREETRQQQQQQHPLCPKNQTRDKE